MTQQHAATPRLGWVLSGDETVPGARIGGINLHQQMGRLGVESFILRQPGGLVDFLCRSEISQILGRCSELRVDTLVLQKVHGPEACRLVREARRRGLRAVFIACDMVDNDLADACDVVFAVSRYLRSLFCRKRGKIHLLEDAIETPDHFRHRSIPIPDQGRLRAVYLASRYPDEGTLRLLDWCAKVADVTILSAPNDVRRGDPAPLTAVATRLAPPRLLWSPRAIATEFYATMKRHRLATIPRMWRRLRYAMMPMPDPPSPPSRVHTFVAWNLDTVLSVLADHHVGVVPVWLNSDFKLSKSVNRLATLMSLGMPVVASPVPAYRDHLTIGRTGFLASEPEEWVRHLARFDADRDLARRMGSAGREYAWRVFAPEVVVHHFLEVLTGGKRRPAQFFEPPTFDRRPVQKI